MRMLENTQKRTKWILRVTVVICIAVANLLVLTPSTVVNAGVWRGCYGNGCNGKDPQWMGCAWGAITVARLPHPGTASAGSYEYVELRYSPRCHAYWSRVTSRLAHADILYTTAHLSGHPSTRVTRSSASVVWSKMWTGRVSACGVSVWKNDPTYKPILCVS